MRCAGARGLFTARLDDHLSPEAAAALARHLDACPACAAELARWERAAGALRADGPTPVPPGLAERAWHAAMESRAPASLAAGFVGPARRAAVAGALAAGAVWAAALLAAPRAEAPLAAAPQDDLLEVAVQLWTAEVPDDG
jgi:anti-sigma factor RsiW